MSTFLRAADRWAILPKGSVIFCPDKWAAKVGRSAGGEPLAWPAFLAANRAWVSTYEVSPEQVRGEKPIPDSARREFARADRVVVATLRGHPVTLLPARP
ncbi:hypothetical protein [Haloferula sargassicola]|uniref:DUF5678 domain-containing protein n=1 Tax=Haloferula sargassicola TaxID=490096 RepID=A0ABP9UL53_9BACT